MAPALSALADVVLIAGARNAQMAFFPLFHYVCCDDNRATKDMRVSHEKGIF